MGRPLRFLPTECPLLEVTCRTVQGRFLLRPSEEVNRVVLGVLARAARRYRMSVCAFSFLSNHYHLLLRPESALQVAEFMNYFNGNVAREIGRLHRWGEKFWGQRYRAIPVSQEPAAQVARLRYLLEQGCKEGLVQTPSAWPGAHCAGALLRMEPIRGVWYDRTGAWKARAANRRARQSEFVVEESLELDRLPCWDDATPAQIRENIERLVDEIVRETAARHRREGSRPVGERAIRRLHPHDRPRAPKRSPAPRFHAATKAVREMLLLLYQAYLEARARVVQALRDLEIPAPYPLPYGIPPRAVAAGLRGYG